MYQAIGNDNRAELKLRAYGLHDWGTTLRGRRIGKTEFMDKALSCFEQSLAFGLLDRKLAAGLLELGQIFRDKGDWEKALVYLNRGLLFYREYQRGYDLALVFNRLRWYYMYRGDWYQMSAMREEGIKIVRELGNPHFLKMELTLPPASLWAGRWSEVGQSEREALQSLKEVGLFTEWSVGNLAADVGACGKFDESISGMVQVSLTLFQDRRLGELDIRVKNPQFYAQNSHFEALGCRKISEPLCKSVNLT